jgi:hypothetical protein
LELFIFGFGNIKNQVTGGFSVIPEFSVSKISPFIKHSVISNSALDIMAYPAMVKSKAMLTQMFNETP